MQTQTPEVLPARDYWHEPMGPGLPSPAEEVERRFRALPAFRNAAGIAPQPRVSGQFYFDDTKEWSDFLEHFNSTGYRYRVPASGIDLDKLERGRGIGGCLAPVHQDGDVHFVDPSIPAEEFDFVLVMWEPRFYNEQMASDRWKQWLSAQGNNPGPFAIKLLRRLGNDWMLLTNHGSYSMKTMFPGYETAKVIGVIRATLRNGRHVYDDNAAEDIARFVGVGRAASQIGSNAATEIATASASSTTITNTQHTPDGQSFNTQIVSVSITNGTSGTVNVEVTVSAFVQYTDGGGLGFVLLQYSLQQDSAYDGFQEQEVFFDNTSSGDQNNSNLTLSKIFTVPSATTSTFKFMAAKLSSGDTVTVKNAEIRATMVKR